MTWVKIDDKFYDHPKVIAAGPTPIFVWIRGLTWVANNKTAGYIPRYIAQRFVPKGSRLNTIAGRLVEVGFWEIHETGWMFHDWEQYQSQTKIAKPKTKIAEAPPRTSGRSTKRDASATQARRKTPVSAGISFPVPIPIPQPPTSVAGPVAPAGAIRETTQTILASWLDHYPGNPPKRVKDQLAAEIKRLLDEGFSWDLVNASVAEWHRRSLHPSALPSVLDQLQHPAVATRPRPAANTESTVDLRVRNTLQLGESLTRRMGSQAVES